MDLEVINVIYTSDENFAQLMGVSMYSMLDNFSSKKYKIKVTILDGGIADESKKKLRSICEKFSSEIIFTKVSDDDFKDCPPNHPLRDDVTITTFYRLIIPRLFKDEVEKVIYIDCDTLVLGNIEELYVTNIDSYYLGAVRDFVESSVLRLDYPYYKYMEKYFNAGMLLMNLKKMRLEKISEKAFDFIKNHAHELLFPDQDTLNYLCLNDWLVLDKKWNFQVDRSQEKVTPTPNILHFTTAYKPGHLLYHNYYQKFYKKYLVLAWPGYKLKPVPSLGIAVKQLIKFIPFSAPIARKIKKILNL